MPRPSKPIEFKQAKQELKEFKTKQLNDRKENNKKARIEKTKEQTYCNDCKKYINTQNIARHILTQKHIDKNVSPTEKELCFICKGSFTKKHSSEHEKTAKHIKALRERKHQ